LVIFIIKINLFLIFILKNHQKDLPYISDKKIIENMKSKIHKNFTNNNNFSNAYNIINIGSISNISLNTNNYEYTDIKKNDLIKDDLDDYDRVNLQTVTQEDGK